MKKVLLLVVSLFFAPASFAEYTYDWTTGNYYTTTPSYGGGANVQGFNSRNDSS